MEAVLASKEEQLEAANAAAIEERESQKEAYDKMERNYLKTIELLRVELDEAAAKALELLIPPPASPPASPSKRIRKPMAKGAQWPPRKDTNEHRPCLWSRTDDYEEMASPEDSNAIRPYNIHERDGPRIITERWEL